MSDDADGDTAPYHSTYNIVYGICDILKAWLHLK